MIIAQCHSRERLPASLRQIGVTISLASLTIIAGCSSQPSLGVLQEDNIQARGECREHWVLACRIDPVSSFDMEPRSSCECQPIERFELPPMQGRFSRWRTKH